MPKDTTANTESESGAPTSVYATRKKQYKYSNTRAPYTPAPARGPVRPPLPPLATRRETVGTATKDSDKSPSVTHANPERVCNVSESNNTELRQSSVGVSSSTDRELDDGETSGVSQPSQSTTSFTPGIHHLEGIPEDTEVRGVSPPVTQQNVPTISSDVPTLRIPTSEMPASTTFNHPPFSTATSYPPTITICTPRRPTQSGHSTTPTVVIFSQPPDWALFDDDHDKNFPPYASISSLPFDQPEGIQATNSVASLTDNICNPPSPPIDDPFSSDPDQIYPSQSSSDLRLLRSGTSASDSSGIGIRSPVTIQLTPRRITAPAALPTQPAPIRPTFSDLRNAVLQSMPPLPNSALILASAAAPALAIPPGSSSVPVFTSGPAPVPYAPHDPQPVLRQSNFSYDEVAFIDAMTKRWTFYLATDHCFPATKLQPQEACIAYAEKVLSESRTAYPNIRLMFNYVYKKHSRIRNDFQDGLLQTVEDSYDVSNKETSSTRITELISDSNFIFVEYDVNDKSAVVGRYRHPCIISVLKIILFSKSSRARPIGLRFIRELMAETPPELLHEFKDKRATSGVPVPAIALASTLILYALQSLQSGDSSRRSATTKKPLSFTEQGYNRHYKKFLKNLKDYARLAELRKFLMEHIMAEYLSLQKGIDSDEWELDLDDGTERFSDGE